MPARLRVLLGASLAAEDCLECVKTLVMQTRTPPRSLRRREAHLDLDKLPKASRRGAKNVPQQGKGHRAAPCARLLMSQMAMRGELSEIRVTPCQRRFCDLSAPLPRQAQTISNSNRIVTATFDGL